MKKFIIPACVAVFAAALHAATPQAAFDAAIIPGAEYFGFFDAKTSPFAKEVRDIAIKFGEEMAGVENNPAAGVYKNLEKFEDLMKSNGLGEESVEKAAFSVDYSKWFAVVGDALDEKPDAAAKLSIGDIGILIAYLLKEPLAEDFSETFVHKIINLFSEGAQVSWLETGAFAHGGAKGTTVTITFPEELLPVHMAMMRREMSEFFSIKPFALAVLADNKVLLLGREEDVKAAIDRANAGKKTEFSPVAKKLMEGRFAGKSALEHEGAFFFVMPDVVRRGIGKIEKDVLAGGFLPAGMGVALEAAKHCAGLRIAMNADEKMDTVINIVLDTPERAALFRDFMDITALNLAKMALFQASGKNTPFAQSLKAVAEDDSVSLHCTVTAADYKALLDFGKKMEEKQRQQREQMRQLFEEKVKQLDEKPEDPQKPLVIEEAEVNEGWN